MEICHRNDSLTASSRLLVEKACRAGPESWLEKLFLKVKDCCISPCFIQEPQEPPKIRWKLHLPGFRYPCSLKRECPIFPLNSIQANQSCSRLFPMSLNKKKITCLFQEAVKLRWKLHLFGFRSGDQSEVFMGLRSTFFAKIRMSNPWNKVQPS